MGGNDNKDTVKIKSLRVDLLSTEEQIRKAMKGDNEITTDRTRLETNNIIEPPPTAVSTNKNVQQFGNEAIGFFEKIDDNLSPHLDFDTRISWSVNESNNIRKKNENLEQV